MQSAPCIELHAFPRRLRLHKVLLASIAIFSLFGWAEVQAVPFTFNDDGTVTDNQSGFIWLRDANCFGQLTLGGALTAAGALSDGQCGLTDGSGVGGWQLPSIGQLETLRARQPPGPFEDPNVFNAAGTGQWTQGNAFFDIQSGIDPVDLYWSITLVPCGADPNSARVMHFFQGASFACLSTNDPAFVWPVKNTCPPKDGDRLVTIPDIFRGTSCPPSSSSPIRSWPDAQGNRMELFCLDLAVEEYALNYSGRSGAIGRCPWLPAKNYGKLTYRDYDADGTIDCFVSSFHRSREEGRPYEPNIPPIQGTSPDLLDWWEYEYDVARDRLICTHYTSLDGIGGPGPDTPVDTQCNISQVQLSTLLSADLMVAEDVVLDCDVDGNGVCDTSDIEFTESLIGQCRDGSNFNVLADADHDGCITSNDIVVLLIPPVIDTDVDLIPDDIDNCTESFNVDQRDTDGDGFGNRCDADLNGDCIVNPVDLGLFRSVFFSGNADADFNGDGVVNPQDLGILRSLFFLPPGPTALPNDCN